jgi:hypothetical protein
VKKRLREGGKKRRGITEMRRERKRIKIDHLNHKYSYPCKTLRSSALSPAILSFTISSAMEYVASIKRRLVLGTYILIYYTIGFTGASFVINSGRIINIIVWWNVIVCAGKRAAGPPRE